MYFLKSTTLALIKLKSHRATILQKGKKMGG